MIHDTFLDFIAVFKQRNKLLFYTAQINHATRPRLTSILMTPMDVLGGGLSALLRASVAAEASVAVLRPVCETTVPIPVDPHLVTVKHKDKF